MADFLDELKRYFTGDVFVFPRTFFGEQAGAPGKTALQDAIETLKQDAWLIALGGATALAFGLSLASRRNGT